METNENRDFSSSPRPFIRKIVELRLRGTPAQIGNHIIDLSNQVLKEAGYLPFMDKLPTNLRDPSIKTRFPSDTNVINDIIVYPMEFERLFMPGEPRELPEMNLGVIDLLAGRRDGQFDFTYFRFSCNELDWPQYEPRLTQLCEMLTDRGFPVVTESEIKQFPQPTTKPGGRPSDADYDWAYAETNVKGRDKREVYNEWLKRRSRASKQMPADPRNAFKDAMKSRRKKEVGVK